MSAFIFNNRLYLLTNNAGDENTIQSYKPKYVKTRFGLLMMTSMDNLVHLNIPTFPQAAFAQNLQPIKRTVYTLDQGRYQPAGPAGFFVINAVENSVKLYDGYGNPTTIYRDQLNDVGFIHCISNQNTIWFLNICLNEPDMGPRAFYTALSKSEMVGSFSDEFISNSEGISIDELFNHPYATPTGATYPNGAQPPYYPGSGLVPPAFQPREPFPRYPNPTPVPSFQPNQPFTDNLWNPISCAPNTVPLGRMVQHPFGTNPVGTGTNPYQPNNHPESNDQVKFNTSPPGLKASNTFFGKPRLWNVDVPQTRGNTSLVNEELGEASSGVYATIIDITSAPCVENGKYNHTIVLKVNENDQEPAIVFRVSNCIELEVRVGNRVKFNDEKSMFSYRLKEVTAPRYVSNDYPKNFVPPFNPNQTCE